MTIGVLELENLQLQAGTMALAEGQTNSTFLSSMAGLAAKGEFPK